MTQPPHPDEEQRVSRFRLVRLLGQGAQGVVYEGYDPTLDRPVAIKTLCLDAEIDPGQADQLTRSAKRASRLNHPNIVQVFEVGVHSGQPYVVFEYVEGTTLADLLRAEGGLSMPAAVVMMSQILAGITHVHASGLLHGDIKPANILIDKSGMPRVTDFGIARPALGADAEPVNTGTVQYMAPESLNVGQADYRSDVFALGLLFHEMLTGKPVFEAGNEYALMYRILNETVQPPSASNPRIDRRLDEIILKAVQRSPENRYRDAGQMKADLDRCRVPRSSVESVQLQEAAIHSTAEFLLRRMALKSDFPALSASVNRINELTAKSDEASLNALSALIMRDFALTQKLLRVVNAASFGAGKVGRVSQAITLLGVSRVRALAIGMMLANGGRNARRCPAVASALTDIFVAGVIAREIGRMIGVKPIEELFICGMFSHLGQLLTLYYLKDEHHAIQQHMADKRADPQAASRTVLGLSFDELGVQVAKHWNFPAEIVRAMQTLPEGVIEAAGGETDRLGHCAGFARELCALARTEDSGLREEAFAAHLRRFALAVPVEEAPVRELIARSVLAASHYLIASESALAPTTLLDGLRALSVPRDGSADDLSLDADPGLEPALEASGQHEALYPLRVRPSTR